MTDRGKAYSVLSANTLAFAVCFAVWVMYGVLVAFLVDAKLFSFDKGQVGLLIGVPILTGSLLRLPAGLLTDRFGGRPVFTAILLLSAAFTYLTSLANGFWAFVLCGLGFGLAGCTFAVGVAYTAVWFPPEKRGTALGIFGVGNVGAGLASLLAPQLLGLLTENGANPDGWRQMPRLYAAALVATAVLFWLVTYPRRAEGPAPGLAARLRPLRVGRVWRFGLYYFVLFGGFVALSSWLISYYVNVYGATVATAGALASVFSLPSGLVRALGGWLSDRYGARRVMYVVLCGCCASFLALAVPRMDVYAPGEGLMAPEAGTVESVEPSGVVLNGKRLALSPRSDDERAEEGVLVWPQWRSWQEPAVSAGQQVVKKQLLARGVTHVYFQANIWIFAGLAFVAALFMGTGMAAVYKHIADYFPKEVGAVGGLVGVIGGLGGFFGPVLFGYVLKTTGIWTTCWVLLLVLSIVCLAWMHRVVQTLMARSAPHVARDMDQPSLSREVEQVAREMEELAQRLRRRQGQAVS